MESLVEYLTLECDLSGSHAGGLGILASDTFFAAKKDGYPFYGFSIFYPRKLQQKFWNEYLYNEIVDVKKDFLNKVLDFELKTKWYPVAISVYLHNLSTEKTRFYFIEIKPVKGNKWLNDLTLYNEKDEGQQVFLRWVFPLAVAEFSKVNGIKPSVVHMNESDTALSPLAFYYADEKFFEEVRYIGHTHTPEPHGHKRFRAEILESLLPNEVMKKLREDIGKNDSIINFGWLLGFYSEKLCCVSKQHEEVTKKYLYPEFRGKITSVTNGVDYDWINPYLRKLFDEYIPGWRNNPQLLENVKKIPDKKITEVERLNKEKFSEEFSKLKNNSEIISNFDKVENKRIAVFAKRLTRYKRPDKLLDYLKLFEDLGITLIVAGKPIDDCGWYFLQDLIRLTKKSSPEIAYVLNYDREKAKSLILGCDIWLNIPFSLREACGTSPHKAVINGKILVSTRAGGVPEFVKDEENGFLVEDNLSNFDEKLKKAVKLTENDSSLVIFKKNAISSWSVTGKRMFDELKELYNLSSIPTTISILNQ